MSEHDQTREVSSRTKVYTYDYENVAVVERECATWGYPNKDSAGDTMYENTHFRTPLEAAEKLVRELEASMSIDVRGRRRALAEVDRVTKEIAETADRLVRAKGVLDGIRRGSADGK